MTKSYKYPNLNKKYHFTRIKITKQ